MKKKAIILLSIVLMLSLLAACGKSAESPAPAAETPAPTSAEPTAAAEPTTAAEPIEAPKSEDSESNSLSLYEPILSLYRDAMESILDPERLLNSNLSILCMYCYQGQPLDNLGYQLIDLDGDGSEELLIAAISGDEFVSNVIFDMYCLENGQPRQVLQSRERERFFISSEGTIFTDWSNSASDSGVTEFSYSAGELTEMGSAEDTTCMTLALIPFSTLK